MEPTPQTPGDTWVEPVRQRRRRELRDQLSATATAMFLERGIDAVTVADIARACGVSEKTVFNHFPSKESLLLDRWDEFVDTVTRPVTERDHPLVDLIVSALEEQLDELTAAGRASHTQLEQLWRFGEMLRSAPSLIDHRHRQLQKLDDALLTAIAARLRTQGDDPRARMTARMLTSLIAVFYDSLHIHASQLPPASALRRAVRRDLRRAADLLRSGISNQ